MRTTTGPAWGRIAALVAVTLLAALGALGNKADPAFATGCTFRLAADGVNGADYTATEGEGPGGGFHIVVEKMTLGCAGQANLAFSSGTATPPGDYSPPGSVGLAFASNVTTREFNFFPNDDAVTGEPSETLTVDLTAASGDFTTSPTLQTLTILDNDGPPVFSFSAANYNTSESSGTVQITVNRSGATGLPVSVQYATSNGTAIGGSDFTSIAPTTLNFSSVETSKTFNVTILNDGVSESSEQFNLVLSSPSDGGSVGANSTVTITDDDGVGTIQFGSTTYNVTESSGSASILVTRTGGSTGSASVTCTFSAGSAMNGVDFSAGSMVVNFASGETAQYCNVPILSDATAEPQETVALTLSCPCTGVGAASSPSSATLYIDDDDGTGNVAFSSASYAGTENGGAITITVNRTSGSGAGSVTYAASTGGAPAAIAGTDFIATTGTLSWGVGDFSSRTFTVTPIDDATVEGSENILLTLSGPTGGLTLGSPSVATLVLSDNESPLPVITSISPASGTILGGTAVTITGTNFVSVSSVTFGGLACSSVSVISSLSLTCVTPAHTAGTVEVVVTALAGSNSTVGTANDYTYTGGPTVTSLSPATGPATGNTIVTITGTNFTASGMVVKFDTTTAVFSFIDTTTIIAVAPAHSGGTVDVIVTTPGGTSPNTAADDYIYTGSAGPVIALLSPASGPVGTTVIIAGSGFTGATLVTFGGIAATYTVNNDAQITASVPAGTPAGTVDVRVTTGSGTSPNTTADNFNNTSASPTITYTLYFRFTLIVWTGPNGISALVALKGQENPDNPATNNVSTLVGAIWRFDATTQTFKGYFPGSDGVPGANDFTTLTTGVGYFIALLNPGTVTWTTLGAN